MSKFLSIVIPRYDENERDVFPLLASISGQLGINFGEVEVIIACDGGGPGPLDEDFLDIFNMEVRQISLPENRGPGVARQAGLDVATGDYVMFCDADDTLHSVGVLGGLIKEARENVPDILTSSWLEEIQDPATGGYFYINHQIENTWMHGKFLRRAFIQKHNIRFHDELRVHEDSYFLAIAAALSERNRHIDMTSYVWKYRTNSITRRNDGIYTYNSFATFIEACSMSHRELENHAAANMEWKILQFVLYVYFSTQKEDWRTEDHLQYKEQAERMLAKQMKPFWRYWTNATPQKIQEIYNQERNRTFAGRIEVETIDHWIDRIMNMEEDVTPIEPVSSNVIASGSGTKKKKSTSKKKK